MWMYIFDVTYFHVLPSIEALLGRIVTAPSATSSCSSIGEFLAPQLSDPTKRKWPVRLAFFADCNTLLKKDMHPWHCFYITVKRITVSLLIFFSSGLCLFSLKCHATVLDSLDIVLVGKNNDPASIGGLHQSLDDFFKLPRSGLSGDLYGLSNAQPSCAKDTSDKLNVLLVLSISSFHVALCCDNMSKFNHSPLQWLTMQYSTLTYFSTICRT